MNQMVLRERLAAWEAKTDTVAPLTEKQRDSIMELTTQSAVRPLPIELPLEDFPTITTHMNDGSSVDVDSVGKCMAEFDLGGQKVENAQQFFSWFAEVEEKMEAEEEEGQRAFIEQLQEYRDQCTQVLSEVSHSLDHLKALQSQYVLVSTKTNALHEACEHLLAEQTKLVNTAESINNRLSYFNELERISSKLGSPTLAVTSESFVPMLSRLDECIAYIQGNPQYKETHTYLARFKQCLCRALTLIKTHVVNLLQSATQHVLPKKDGPPQSENAFTLFYGKFRTNAPRVKSLMEQIEQRIDKSPEYSQMLTDCHQCYFQQRLTLLGPSVSSALTDLSTKHVRDHCALMRSGCAFMVHVCEDEYQLFSQFFTHHTTLLDSMLLGLCNQLYDVLRPLIIHVNHLETLAELCSIMKVEMLEEHVLHNPKELQAFETVCLQMLEDVQERLVYRTHIYIRSDILNYHPAAGDLAYPEKLEMMESIAESIKQQNQQHTRSGSIGSVSSISSNTSQEVAQITSHAEENGERKIEEPVAVPAVPVENGGLAVLPLNPNMPEPFIGSNMPMSPADLHGMWYPTVRRTLVCLSKLFRCVDRTTFQGLSQEALSMCIQSLVEATDSIKKRKNSEVDGELFLIKHLLILREQIAPFHIDFAVRETALDFSKLKDAAYGLMHHKSMMFALNRNNAFLQFLLEGSPQVTEHFLDSKREVDTQLKKSCEDFIRYVSDTVAGPLHSFLTKAEVIVKHGQGDTGQKISLRQQPFASPEKVHEAVTQTYKHLKQKIPSIQKSMMLYLANRDTEHILFKPIKVNIQHAFQQLHTILSENYSEEDQQIIGCPSLDQINLVMKMTP